MNFEINFIFLIKPVFSRWPKSHEKSLNILWTKRAFKNKLRAFSIILRGLPAKQITHIFWEEGWGPTLMFIESITVSPQVTKEACSLQMKHFAYILVVLLTNSEHVFAHQMRWQ